MTSPVLYRIHKWNENFENKETRKLKTMKWIPVPTKQDGDGYTELMEHRNGAAHFGVWTALIQLAAKCCERGLLMRATGSPHTAESIARIVRMREAVITEAIEQFVKIGWLEALKESPGKTGENPDAPGKNPPSRPPQERVVEDSTVQERRGEGTDGDDPPPSSSSTSGDAPPPKAGDPVAANRMMLVAILTEFGSVLEMAGKPIIHEWFGSLAIPSGGTYPVAWIDHLFRVRRQIASLPSDLRKILRKTHGDFEAWRKIQRKAG